MPHQRQGHGVPVPPSAGHAADLTLSRASSGASRSVLVSSSPIPVLPPATGVDDRELIDQVCAVLSQPMMIRAGAPIGG